MVMLKSGLEITQGHWKWHYSVDRIRVLSAFHGNYGPILYHFRDKARYGSKIIIIVPLNSTPS